MVLIFRLMSWPLWMGQLSQPFAQWLHRIHSFRLMIYSIYQPNWCKREDPMVLGFLIGWTCAILLPSWLLTILLLVGFVSKPSTFFDLMSVCVRHNGQNQTPHGWSPIAPKLLLMSVIWVCIKIQCPRKKVVFVLILYNVSKALVNTVNHLQFDHKWLV